MNFLNNLETLLSENDMSRAELARVIGIAPSTINAWYTKSCDGISLKTLRAIADYFSITIEELVNARTVTAISFSSADFSARELHMIYQFSKMLKDNRLCKE